MGYKLHARCDVDAYLDALHVTAANAHESQHLLPLLEGLEVGTELLADKGYASKENRKQLRNHGLVDGIMHKAVRGKPLSEGLKKRNGKIKKNRWVIEQSFGTVKRIFGFSGASYFGQAKVLGQSYLKAICLNLLKASNKVEFR